MTDKQKRMLELLDGQILECKCCNLYENGRAKPYWTEKSKYLLLLEAPGKTETETGEPLTGKTGQMFWDLMAEQGLTKEMFMVINSVNCRSMKGSRNIPPSEHHRSCCRKWLKKYFQVFQPDKVVLMGNPSIHTALGVWGVSKVAGELTNEEVFGIYTTVIKSYHPSAMIYGPDKKENIVKCIQKLKE